MIKSKGRFGILPSITYKTAKRQKEEKRKSVIWRQSFSLSSTSKFGKFIDSF